MEFLKFKNFIKVLKLFFKCLSGSIYYYTFEVKGLYREFIFGEIKCF